MNYFNNFSKNIIDKNKQKSFLLYYIKHILTIIILPLSLFFVSFSMLYVNSFNDNIKGHIRSTAEKNASIIDHIFFYIDTYYKSCSSDSSINSLRCYPIEINNTTGSLSPVREATGDAYNLNLYINCVDSIYFYAENYNYIYGLIGNTSSYFDNFSDKIWYDEYLRQDSSDYISMLDYGGSSYLTFCYNLGSKTDFSGILVIKISTSRLCDQFNLINNDFESMKLVSDITRNELLRYGNAVKKSIEYSVPLDNYPATLYYSSSSGIYQNQQIIKTVLFVLFAVLTLVLTVFLALLFSRKEYNGILSVISQIEDPYIGNGSDTNKIYTLIKKTNDTTSDKNYESELLDKITNLKKAQLIALQTQINPHFLFNTLYMISSTIIVNNDKDTAAVNMISKLSNILRYALKTEEYIVTIDDELKVLESYISILDTRHGNSFDVEWNIAEDTRSENTLKSILQPLVENSVEHGIQLLYDEKKGKIMIDIYKKNNMLYLSVTDNGVGIPPDKLKELNELLNTDYIFQNTHVGLKNVISRIKILFGDRAGYSIESDSECTKITIYHPVISM